MKITHKITPLKRIDWRRWLAKNHRLATEIWIVFHKKHTGKTGFRYEDAVEEAICFGWIDGIIRTINEDTYGQRFTPRRQGSRWSELNRRRAKQMIAAGKMTATGLAQYREGTKRPRSGMTAVDQTRLTAPGYLRSALRELPAAWGHFAKLPPGYKRMAIRWIMAAKTEVTRNRRVQEFVQLTAVGKRIGMK